MKLKYRAIFTGAAFDIGGSTFFGSVISIFFYFFLSRGGASIQDIYAANYSPVFVSVSLSLGFLFNALGGFVSAKIRAQRYLLFGGLSALPCLVLGFLNILNPLPNYFPLWSIVVGWLLCIPFGVFGGYMASKNA